MRLLSRAEDFSSSYLTGVDARMPVGIDLYQSYIHVDKLFGTSLSARVGRQEISLGNEWLVGNNDAPIMGLSFDGGTDDADADYFFAECTLEF